MLDLAKLQNDVRAELHALAEKTTKRLLVELTAEYAAGAAVPAQTIGVRLPNGTTIIRPAGEPPAPKRRRGRKPQGKRYGVEAREVLAAIRRYGAPVGAEVLRYDHFTTISSAALRRRLTALVEDGSIVATGEKRATRYAIAKKRAKR